MIGNPITPQQGVHDKAIDKILRDLNRVACLDLPIRDKTVWSPSSNRTDHDRCVDLVKQHYFRSRDKLSEIVDDFKVEACQIPDDAKIHLLLRRLGEIGSSSMNGKIPSRAASTAKPASTFVSRLLNESVPSETPDIVSADAWDDCNFTTPPQSPTIATSSLISITHDHPCEHGHPRPIINSPSHPSPRIPAIPDGAVELDAGSLLIPVENNISFSSSQPSVLNSFNSSLQASHSGTTSAATSFSAALPDDVEVVHLRSTTQLTNVFDGLSGSLLHALGGDTRPNSPETVLRLVWQDRLPSSDPDNELRRNEIKQERTYQEDGIRQVKTLDRTLSHEHYLMKTLPSAGLFACDETQPTVHETTPFIVRYECARLAGDFGVALDSVLQPSTPTEFGTFWDYIESLQVQPAARKSLQPISKKIWDACAHVYSGISLKGHLQWASQDSSVFKLHLQAPQLGESCRFQRKYGGDRFLYLKIPRLNRVPSVYQAKQELLKQRFLEWLITEKDCLGRRWRAVHFERISNNKRRQPDRRFQDENQVFEFRVVLFAVSGVDIAPIETGTQHPFPSSYPSCGITELLHWFMPVAKTGFQPFCKAFARLDLGFSTTRPSITFKPSQVRRVPDALSNHEPECTRFDDPDLPSFTPPSDSQHIMDDGCARISLGACRLVWQHLGSIGPMPSAFQARINGAKGVWIRSAPIDSTFDDDNDVWIEISDSQEKFGCHDEDTDESFDPARWTFEIIRCSRKVTSSVMHMSFLPILLDRGITASTIHQVVAGELDDERQSLVAALSGPQAMRFWIHKNHSLLEEQNRDAGVTYQAGLPLSLVEKAILLLESGFDPCKLPFLGDLVLRVAKKYFTKVIQSLSVKLSKSVSVLGVADPTGTLEPGEIHLAFSEPLVDEATGEACSILRDREAIVTRHPTLRRSDVQKVRCVYKPELSHLLDVVVFSSRGQVPLASKLQGGDYDGDTFWICWDRRLVDGFRNAPANLDTPTPEQLGITVDRRKLAEVMPASNFLQESFKFRLQPDLLGRVTNTHEKLVYETGSVHGPAVDAFANLHDVIIDSAKNGYIFTEEDYRRFEAKHLHGQRLSVPAYKEALEKGLLYPHFDKFRPVSARLIEYKKDNIIDQVYFTIVKPHIDQTFVVLDQTMCKTQDHRDDDIVALLEQEKTLDNNNEDLLNELAQLKQSLQKISDYWSFRFQSARTLNQDHFEDPDMYNEVLDKCYQDFQDISPINKDHPIVLRWLRAHTGAFPSRWDLLKAATLFEIASSKGTGTFVFHIAGNLLCHLKAASQSQSRVIVPSMWAQMKPRRCQDARIDPEQAEVEDFFDSDNEDDWQTALA